MSVIDTHCHLDLIRERGLDIADVLASATQNDVSTLVQIATNFESSLAAQKLSQNSQAEIAITQTAKQATKEQTTKEQTTKEQTTKEEGSHASLDIYWTAGLHPANAGESEDEVAKNQQIFALVRKHYQEERFMGIGETGLDYFHIQPQDTAGIMRQKKSFMDHLQLAKELHLPLILHIRDDRIYNPDKTAALQDCLALVKEAGVQGVLHCFSYSYDEAKPFVDLGWFVSYSGMLTFKNATVAQAGAIRLPLDCLLVETDAPFLAPMPHRGKVNQPAYVRHTLDFLVALRAKNCGEDEQDVRQGIFANSQRFLELKKAA